MPPNSGLGQTIPPGNIHAVSVSLPTWEATLGWARRDVAVVSKMHNGYPRFFVHPLITQLSRQIVEKFIGTKQQAMLFPTHAIAERCLAYVQENCQDGDLRCICHSAESNVEKDSADQLGSWTAIHAVLFEPENILVAKQFWQHTGEGISSRYAEHSLSIFNLYIEGCDELRYRGLIPEFGVPVIPHSDAAAAAEKYQIRQRIAALISSDSKAVSPDDVFLYSSGMNAMSDLYQALILTRKSQVKKVVAYGFVYVDTFKVLSKFGPKEAILYGHGNARELDDLEEQLEAGERIMALFCELPSNPLLVSPDLARIRMMADKYDFVVVCDETVGTFVNVDVLPYVDVVITSLTKLFSGECDVMGGSTVVNPQSRHQSWIHSALASIYVDNYFPPDAMQMWKNCDNFIHRVHRINDNAERLALLLQEDSRVETVYYPSLSPSKAYYDQYKRPGGGYSYLVTVLFKSPPDAALFFDALDVAKGPSLGTTFTLACPYTLFGHYGELDWAAQYGVVEHLVRISVGSEPLAELVRKVEVALQAIGTSGADLAKEITIEN